jgi:hypothetical protein
MRCRLGVVGVGVGGGEFEGGVFVCVVWWGGQQTMQVMQNVSHNTANNGQAGCISLLE